MIANTKKVVQKLPRELVVFIFYYIEAKDSHRSKITSDENGKKKASKKKKKKDKNQDNDSDF